VLAIGIGVVPFLKKLILTDDAPMFFFTDSCLILGYFISHPNFLFWYSVSFLCKLVPIFVYYMVNIGLVFSYNWVLPLFIMVSLVNFREAMIPCILLALGGNLVNGMCFIMCSFYIFLRSPWNDFFFNLVYQLDIWNFLC
jgi:hypothetical protein